MRTDPMASPWFRLQCDYYLDRDLRKAGPDARVCWPALLCVIKQGRGYASDADLDPFALADIIGGDERMWEMAISRLEAVGLLVKEEKGWTARSWARFQPDARPNSRSRDVPGTPRDTQGTPVTRTMDHRQETEQENNNNNRAQGEHMGEFAAACRPRTVEDHGTAEWVERMQARLGMPRSRHGSDIHARWLGIARNPKRAEVEALAKWAIDNGDGGAFLRCFDDEGEITSKKPTPRERGKGPSKSRAHIGLYKGTGAKMDGVTTIKGTFKPGEF